MNYQDLLQSRIIPPQIVPLIQKACQNSVPVLLQGEQGIGKEAVAKAIHQSSEWKYHRFYRVDCKMLKEGTLHAQLGQLFKEIQYGTVPATLFLKEVGFLSLEINQDFSNCLKRVCSRTIPRSGRLKTCDGLPPPRKV